jgi:biopolymer transport protein ExbD
VSIKFSCDSCGKRLKAGDRQGGRKVKCPGCGQAQTVPEPQGERPVSEPPAPPRQTTAAQFYDDEPVSFDGPGIAEEEMDLTPMVDVTFLLLIFFMVTAAFNLQKSIEMPPPDEAEASTQAPTLEELEDDFIIVAIEKDEISGRRDTILVDDVEVIGERELLRKLREAREGGADGARGPGGMLVVADEDVRHETVVMVLDAGTAVGMENVRLASPQ